MIGSARFSNCKYSSSRFCFCFMLSWDFLLISRHPFICLVRFSTWLLSSAFLKSSCCFTCRGRTQAGSRIVTSISYSCPSPSVCSLRFLNLNCQHQITQDWHVGLRWFCKGRGFCKWVFRFTRIGWFKGALCTRRVEGISLWSVKGTLNTTGEEGSLHFSSTATLLCLWFWQWGCTQ